VGGCDLIDLARAHGTPLYVYDEDTVRQKCREYMAAMGSAGQVLYSAKAFASPQFLRIVAEEGLGLDVVSAGELHIALKSGFPTDRLHFLGNNKSWDDLDAAYRAGATIVIDGFQEFDVLARIVPDGQRAPVMLRISPGVKPDTHDHIATGQLDSKFGFSIESGAARKAVEQALAQPNLELVGLHSHIGSQIFALGAYEKAMAIMLDLLVQLRDELRYEPRKLGAGGGLGIAYTSHDDPPTPRHFVETIRRALDAGCASRGLNVPQLVVEPGRSIAGPAGVALYTVGSIKDIPGVRRYVAVDALRRSIRGIPCVRPRAPGRRQGHDRGQVLRVDRYPDHGHRDARAGDRRRDRPASGRRLLPRHGQQLQRDAETRGRTGARRRCARHAPPGNSGRPARSRSLLEDQDVDRGGERAAGSIRRRDVISPR